MLKKIFRSLSVLLVLVILFTLTSLPTSASNNEEPFYIGTCAHQKSVLPYGKNMEEFVYYNAKMGSNFIRIDLGISSQEDYDYWDEFFALCKKYNTTVMGIVYSPVQAEIFSSRYGEQLKFIQMLNEQDTPSITGGDGTKKEQYNLNVIAEVVGELKEISAVIRENSPKSKLVVNCAFVHYGYFEHLIEQEVDFDVIGMDWYSHCDDWGFDKMLDELSELGKPIFITEANIWQHDTDKQDKMGAKVIEYIEACKRKQKTHNILGLTIYELLDEPQKGTGPGEGIFGLIKLNSDFTIDKPKNAYYEIQEYLGFKNKTVEKAVVTEKDLDIYGLNPYEKNDANQNNSSITDNSSDMTQSNSSTDSSNSSPATSDSTTTNSDFSASSDLVNSNANSSISSDSSTTNTDSSTSSNSSTTNPDSSASSNLTNSNANSFPSSSLTSTNSTSSTASDSSTIASTSETSSEIIIVEPITKTQTQYITDTSEIVEIVYDDPAVIESVTTKNIYRSKNFPIWLIIEIAVCVVLLAIGVVTFFVIRKKLLKSKK